MCDFAFDIVDKILLDFLHRQDETYYDYYSLIVDENEFVVAATALCCCRDTDEQNIVLNQTFVVRIVLV